jgi:hypothetical protein
MIAVNPPSHGGRDAGAAQLGMAGGTVGSGRADGTARRFAAQLGRTSRGMAGGQTERLGP